MEHVLLAAKAVNQYETEPQTVADEDKNRKATAAKALKKLDKIKNFIGVNGSNHLNITFNETIENVEQMTLKIQRKVTLEVSLVLKIYFIYTVYSYRMEKVRYLNLCVFFRP